MSEPNRQLFDQGYESFSGTFPEIAATVGYRPFYVCPQCLRAFPEAALYGGWLTQEHVPPESVGGRKLVLTCQQCNREAGHEMDSDMRREADILDFFGKRLTDAPALLRTETGKVPIRLSAQENEVRALVVPGAAHPADEKAIEADFTRACVPDGWKDFRFNVEFRRFSLARAEASWLRSAYLAFFAALGYRFVFRPEMRVVRQRIADPNTKVFGFRIIQAQPAPEPLLVLIKTPETFRSFAMIYSQHVVMLPFYGDIDLYARLEKQPRGHVELKTGGAYAFPERPSFLDDARMKTLPA